MLVEEVMATDLVTCRADASLRTVAERMLEERVGSVLVYWEGDPAGIVTGTDLIRAGYRSGSSFADVDAASAMSRPLVTISAERTLRRATERMAEEGVNKLPVSDGLEVVGIVTLTDVAYYFSDVKEEIHELERRSYRERGR
jgi:CBS domain-containing protein